MHLPVTDLFSYMILIDINVFAFGKNLVIVSRSKAAVSYAYIVVKRIFRLPM